jgi:hypothetical protein
MKATNKKTIDTDKVCEYVTKWIGWFFNDLQYPLTSDSKRFRFSVAEWKEIQKMKSKIIRAKKLNPNA